jgi:capsular exopolysaccharide synthesis family protein
MLHLDKSLIGIAGGKPHPFEKVSPAEMLKSFMDLLRRQLPIISFFTVLSTGIGIVYLLTTPPMFTAQTSMIIDTRKLQIFPKLDQTPNSAVVDSGMVDSEVEMLKSENVSLAVIKRFDLANDPEFIGRGGGLFQELVGTVSDLFGRQDPTTEYERTRRAAAVFADRLTVKRVGFSYVIQISFASLDPKRAAEIADAVANEYILDQLQAKFQAARQAGGWLRDRLKELREQASAAERAVVEFKIENSIVSTGGPDKRLVHEQQVAELNSQLVIARAQVSEAGARLERIRTVLRTDAPDATVDATVTDSLKNEVITKLRTQYLTLAEREADWARRFGSSHLAVINLRNQMSEIRHSIVDELRQIAETYKSDFEISKQRQAGLEQQLARAVAQSQVADRAQVQLTELESNAESYRTLYNDFLQRYTESVQAQSFPITEARVVTPAARPLKKSYPKTPLVLLISIAGGMMLGLLVGHLRDLIDRVFRTRDQVERLLGLDCLATVPYIKVSKPKGERPKTRKTKGSIAKGDSSPVPTLPPAPNLKLNDSTGDETLVPKINGDDASGGSSSDESTGDTSSSPGVRVDPANDTATSGHAPADQPSDDTASPDVNTNELGEELPLAAELDDGSSRPRIIARTEPLWWQVVDFPLSPYTEAIRSIKIAVDLVRAKISKKVRKPKKILGITSSSPSEGKSTIAASLAQLIANSDKRVILVDCDLRAPRLTRTLAPNARAGLLEVMSGDASLNDVIWTDSSKRLSFLPAVATARIPHTAEIIGADEMRLLFDRLRSSYDYIIADLTPLMPIVDVRATEGLVDYYVFVIEWGRTRIDLVQRSLKEAGGIYSNILGVVLNKVVSSELRRYEGYGGYDHDKYYRR